MKKLLIISSLYPNVLHPYRGLFVREQVRHLRNYYQIKVIGYQFPCPYEEQISSEDGIDLHNILFPAPRKIFPLSILSFYRYAYPKIKRICRDYAPDFVIVHDFAHIPGLYCLGGLLSKYKNALILHNLKSYPGTLNRKGSSLIYRLTLKPSLSKWSKVFTVNSRLAGLVAPYNTRTFAWANGIRPLDDDSPQRTVRSAEFKFLSVGNLVKDKGFDSLILAMGKLRNKGYECSLRIIGKGEELGKLNKLIQREHLQSRVKIDKPMDNVSLRKLMPEFDAFVLASNSETFGIVYLEAMYAGLPVIGSIGQGIYGLFEDGKEALFAKAGDPNDISDKMERLLQDESLRTDLAQKGKQKVLDKYMMDKIMSAIISEIEEQ